MDSRRDRKRRGRYRLLEIGISAFAAGLVGASSCTVFSGLTVPDETGASSSGTTESGAGGDGAGSGGKSASSGSSGSGGSEPGGAITYLTLGEAKNACTLAFECPLLAKSIALSVGVPVDNTNYSQCLTWLAAPVPSRVGAEAQAAILKCVGLAPGCEEAAACLPVEAIESTDDRCSAGSKCITDIDQSTAVDCTAKVAYHCKTEGFAPGSECQESDGTVACVKEGESCSDPGTASCEGDTLVSCKAPGLVQTPCSVAGLACSDPAGSAPAACVGGDPCKQGTAKCSDDRLLACVNGVFLSFNCVNIDGKCFLDMPDKARCEPTGAMCTPSDADVNTCTANGKKITVCVGGAKVQETCQAGTGCGIGPDGKTAYCGN